MSAGARRKLLVSRDGFADPPWLDTAVSWALLERASEGAEPETLRLFRPAPVVAFGPADRLLPGYAAARRAALDAGFAPVDRLAGGRAAIFHEGTIALSWTVPDACARAHIHERFEVLTTLITDALRGLGLDARIGAVPGEYCPGAYSVNAAGRTKVAGLGQRVLPQAAHVGGVIVVEGADRVREALVPVYNALGLQWEPATASSLRDEGLDATWDEVVEALLKNAHAHFEIMPSVTSAAVVEQARSMAPRFAVREGARAAARPVE